MGSHACPKPTDTRKRIAGRKRRAEAKVKQEVRAKCVTRDGDCRLQKAPWHDCGGESEWAHFEEKKRARTRGMPPEERHTTEGSLMLCTTAHRDYDAGRMAIEAQTLDGADGELTFFKGEDWYAEPAPRDSGYEAWCEEQNEL